MEVCQRRKSDQLTRMYFFGSVENSQPLQLIFFRIRTRHDIIMTRHLIEDTSEQHYHELQLLKIERAMKSEIRVLTTFFMNNRDQQSRI